MNRAVVSAIAFALVAAVVPVRVAAQSSGGTIAITVTDAKTKSPVALARVVLDGPILASEVATSAGKVTFTEAPAGIYRARVFARGYRAVTSAPFEVLDGERVSLDVALAPSSDLQVIAVVHSVSSVRISTNSIDANSAQRKLSGDLADALSKLSGVSITSSSDDTDAAQTISLDGHDASQTAMTLDGIPLNAPGSAGDLRMFATDLFTGASVHHGPQIGGLGGGVDFRTLEPTLSWQSQGTLATGSYGRNNESLGISGSLGNLGIAAMSTTRTNPSPADGMRYLDASGLDYVHDGGRWVAGDLLKANLRLPGDQTLAASFINSTRSIGLLCLRVTAALPCGYGPGNDVSGSFSLYSLGDQLLTGATAISATLYGTVGSNLFDLRNRFVDGVASPAGSSMQMRSTGFTISAELPAMRNHTLSVLAYDTNSSQVSTPLVASNAAFYSAQQQGSYGALQLSDRIRANDRLALNASLGLTHASYSGGSALGSIGATWRPSANDSYAISYALSGNAPNFGRSRALSDPASLQFDCQGSASVGYGAAPGDQPGASSSSSLDASVTHRFAGSALSLALYRQVQNGVVLPTQVNGSVLLADGTLSPSYLAQVEGAYASASGCGVGAPPIAASQLYFATPVGGVTRIYSGADLTGFVQIGNLVAEPFFDITSTTLRSNDPRIDNPFAIAISGAQTPNVPLHRAGLTLDYRAPHSAVEWLADAQYTGANNPNNLPAYTTYDAAANVKFTRGTLTVAASNITDAYAGIFASSQDAVPYTTLGGTEVPTIARPLAPRSYSVTYSFAIGRHAVLSLPSPARGGPRPRGPFARFTALPTAAPSDPYALAASAFCTPDRARIASGVLDALRAQVARVEKVRAASPTSAIVLSSPAGVTFTYHPLATGYAVSIAPTKMDDVRALFTCATIHRTDAATAAGRGLYVAPPSSFFRPEITFSPTVGLYFIRRQPQPGKENFRVFTLAAQAPKEPFAAIAGPQCTAALRDVAIQSLDDLRAHFTAATPSTRWQIVAHGSGAKRWFALTPNDLGDFGALMACAHVAAATAAQLQARGLGGAPPPGLNYAPSIGLYIERRTPPPPPGGAPPPHGA